MSKPSESTTPRVNRNVNSGLIATLSVKVHRFNNGALCCQMLVMKEAMCVWGKRAVWELSALPSQFCCESKTALKLKWKGEVRDEIILFELSIQALDICRITERDETVEEGDFLP